LGWRSGSENGTHRSPSLAPVERLARSLADALRNAQDAVVVDFRKHLPKSRSKPSDPTEIYGQLDRTSDKGPLRPVQAKLLSDWYANYREKKDVILKLHTGQGKTLIGLLALQSRLNESRQPALYVCPNNYLVAQTVGQAREFGIPCVERGASGLPSEFKDGTSILVTNIQSLINGRSVFRTGPSSLQVGSICIDDAHACVDAIRAAFCIRIDSPSEVYDRLRTLFEDALRGQGAGQWADICLRKDSAILPVPYWFWQDRLDEVARILAAYEEQVDAIRFPWPVLRDRLRGCQCVVSGTSLEVAPYRAPVELFGSFSNAAHRLFMSATVADDSLLVRDLGVDADALRSPLCDPEERWSGEKMLLIPSRISEQLEDGVVVSMLAREFPKRTVGVVALCPSFSRTKAWESGGAVVARTETMETILKDLRDGQRQKAIVFASRYNGIDLADDQCRVLILDGLPYAETLTDRYVASCRERSAHVRRAIARTIEQGLGRAVRGERDYCAIVLLGDDLIDAVAGADGREFLSAQTQKQVDIGRAIVDLAKEDVQRGVDHKQVLNDLLAKLIRRDPGWKEFYAQQMDELESKITPPRALDVYVAEREAELLYERGDYRPAKKRLQDLIDVSKPSDSERGWYLQEMARYMLPVSMQESNTLQVAAHQLNLFLLKPREGMEFAPIAGLPQRRVAQIIAELQGIGSAGALRLRVNEILDALRFGVDADRFERALNDLGKLLGFGVQRPDRQYGEGPDNLWQVALGKYLLFECKSEIEETRKEINKSEASQMNTHGAWFRQNYKDAVAAPILIIPTRLLGKGSVFSDEVRIMRRDDLQRLSKAVRTFFREAENVAFGELNEEHVAGWLQQHQLLPEDLMTKYGETPVSAKHLR
jgi:replicative superfamily II helicase